MLSVRCARGHVLVRVCKIIFSRARVCINSSPFTHTSFGLVVNAQNLTKLLPDLCYDWNKHVGQAPGKLDSMFAKARAKVNADINAAIEISDSSSPSNDTIPSPSSHTPHTTASHTTASPASLAAKRALSSPHKSPAPASDTSTPTKKAKTAPVAAGNIASFFKKAQ